MNLFGNRPTKAAIKEQHERILYETSLRIREEAAKRRVHELAEAAGHNEANKKAEMLLNYAKKLDLTYVGQSVVELLERAYASAWPSETVSEPTQTDKEAVSKAYIESLANAFTKVTQPTRTVKCTIDMDVDAYRADINAAKIEYDAAVEAAKKHLGDRTRFLEHIRAAQLRLDYAVENAGKCLRHSVTTTVTKGGR